MADLSGKAKGGIAAGIAAMLTIAVPYTASWEGKANDPYFDDAHVKTVCYGDTQVVMQHYTDAQCAELLRKKLAEQYAPAVAKALPGIEDHRYAFAAFTDFAYNAGPAALTRTIAGLWARGDYLNACRFMTNYKYAGGKVLAGLTYRRDGHDTRIGETELCMVDAVPMVLAA